MITDCGPCKRASAQFSEVDGNVVIAETLHNLGDATASFSAEVSCNRLVNAQTHEVDGLATHDDKDRDKIVSVSQLKLKRPTEWIRVLIAGQQRSVLALRPPARRKGSVERKRAKQQGRERAGHKTEHVVPYGHACNERDDGEEEREEDGGRTKSVVRRDEGGSRACALALRCGRLSRAAETVEEE